MLSIAEGLLIFIAVGESILGVLGNGFIGLVNCIDCVKNKKGPPRPRPAPAVGEAEDKENQQAANGPNQPSVRRGYRRPYNYRRRPRPPNAPSQDGKETKAGDVPSENPAPATEQSSAE
ncbi:DNA-binding protein A [Myotis brandtii]|uniref:DNA-binding protein A n=1 Tax=Myotis brandtii TaxID=109478 RepID=S7MUI4_MYOBR|nr:DNA-binding protein A [Myotis brandtii]